MVPYSDHRPPQDLPTGSNQQPSTDQLEYVTWADLLIKNNRASFGRPDADPKFGPWTRRPLPRPSGSDELKRPHPRPPAIAQAIPDKSRAQMIERYRQEMMELVRSMPVKDGEELEPYELSLRDIVESPLSKKPETEPEAEPEAEAALVGSEGGSDKKGRQRRASKRAARGNAGLILIKAIMPTLHALLGGHWRIAGSGAGKRAKISPKPHRIECEGRSSSDGSSASSSDGSRRNRGRKGTCYSFLQRDRGRTMEI